MRLLAAGQCGAAFGRRGGSRWRVVGRGWRARGGPDAGGKRDVRGCDSNSAGPEVGLRPC